MHLTRKRLKQIALGAFIATFLIRIATATSLLSIYDCAGSSADCAGLHQAAIRVYIGSTLQYISLAVLAVSLLALLYLWVTKKDRL